MPSTNNRGKSMRREQPTVGDSRIAQYLRVRTNPDLANLTLEQLRGPRGKLAAARYSSTRVDGSDDPDWKDMPCDFLTKELSQVEIAGALMGILNKGAEWRLAENVAEEELISRGMICAGGDPLSVAGIGSRADPLSGDSHALGSAAALGSMVPRPEGLWSTTSRRSYS